MGAPSSCCGLAATERRQSGGDLGVLQVLPTLMRPHVYKEDLQAHEVLRYLFYVPIYRLRISLGRFTPADTTPDRYFVAYTVDPR